MEHEYYPPGHVVFEIDTLPDKFYLILEGEVGVYARPIAKLDKK